MKSSFVKSYFLMAGLFLALLLAPGAARASSDFGVEKVTYDLGLASGSYNNLNYTEVEGGIGLFFNDYFEWRNGIFARFTDQESNTYGLDSSVRGILSMGGRSFGVTAYAGPGFRFATQGDSAPFAEGGLVFKISGIAVGLGVKSILDSWVHSGVGNDTQILIILGGGGVF